MKKILSIVCFVLSLCSGATAQTQAGRIFMGTSLSWNNNENTYPVTNGSGTLGSREEKNSNFFMQPLIGTFVSDNLVLGIFVNYENYSNKIVYSNQGNNASNEINGYTVGPFVRKFFPLNEKFALYGQGNIGYNHRSTRYEPESVGTIFGRTSKSNSLMAGLKPGIVFFATNKIGVDLSVQGLQYSIGKVKNTSESFINLDAGFNLPNVNIGLNLYLGK